MNDRLWKNRFFKKKKNRWGNREKTILIVFMC